MKCNILQFFLLIACFVGCLCRSTPEKRRLEKHGVSESIQRAIDGMTASRLPKHVIHDNIQRHFPDKKSHEINDIISTSNDANKRRQPKTASGRPQAKRKR